MAIARARGVPGQPRAGDGAQRPLAARDARGDARARRSSSARARSGWRGASTTARRSRTRSTNVGTALLGGAEHERGRRAARGGVHARAARSAPTSTRRARWSTSDVDAAPSRRPAVTRRTSSARSRFARERELDGYVQYVLGVRANLRAAARRMARRRRPTRAPRWTLGEQPGVSLCPALVALGRLQSRRGDPEAGATLEDAWRLAVASQELQRLGPPRRHARSTRGSTATWPARPRRRGRRTSSRSTAASRGRAASSRSGSGAPGSRSIARANDPEPYACALAGDWGGAARGVRRQLGFPYEPRRHADGGRRRGGAARGAGDLRPARRRARPRRTCGGGCAPTACAGSRAVRGRRRGPGWPA